MESSKACSMSALCRQESCPRGLTDILLYKHDLLVHIIQFAANKMQQWWRSYVYDVHDLLEPPKPQNN
eukprot:6391560-Amphidinium_carterae.1